MQATLDHLILGVNNLQNGIQQFHNLTGIQPIFGGQHPGIGTHNALISFADGKYLEIIAPIDGSKPLTGPFRRLNQFENLTPIGWVLGSSDLGAIEKLLDKFQIENTGVLPLSRKTANGGEIHWKNIFLLDKSGMSINPFFIQWEIGGTHPSEVTPKGCSLVKYKIGLSKNNSKIKMLKALSLNIDFEEIQTDRNGNLLSFVLDTPNGIVPFL